MSTIRIETPRGRIIETAYGRAVLEFNDSFSGKWEKEFSRKQAVVDSEVLRYCSAMIPFRTGVLMESGTLGTVIGGGVVEYIAPYARRQYYDTALSRSYAPNRGARWFDRMKAKHKADILRAAREAGGHG